MTLVNARAAFEKAVTDSVADADPTVLKWFMTMCILQHPGKDKKYILMSVDFNNQLYKIREQLQIIMLVLFNVMCMFQRVKGTATLVCNSEGCY